MKNVLVVYNVNAGRKQSIKYKKKLHKFLLQKAKSFKIISIDELETVETKDFDTIIAMGGDGTVHKVVPYIVNTDKTLAIIPCGTANLLAAKLGISNNFNRTIKVLENGVVRKIDVLKINDCISTLRLGIGYDSNIICKTPQKLKQKFGYFGYFLAGILFALRLRKKEYILNVDNNTIKVNASCIMVANAANMYQNVVSFSKKSEPDDGLMEIFVLKTTNPILFFFEIIKMVLKIQHTNNNAMYFQAQDVNISSNFVNAHIDGEKKNFKGNINISIKKNILNVINNN